MNGPSNDSPAVTTRNQLGRAARTTEPTFQGRAAGNSAWFVLGAFQVEKALRELQ